MTEDQREWQKRLYMRAARLIRLIELNAPQEILMREKDLFVKAVVRLKPESLVLAFAGMAVGIAEEIRVMKASLEEDEEPTRPEGKWQLLINNRKK